MITINKRQKNSYLNSGVTENFRNDVVMLGKRNGNVVYLSGYKNSFISYRLITTHLSAGIHKFRIRTYDKLLNVNSQTNGQVTISSFTLPPRLFTSSVVNGNLSLSWVHSVSGAPDSYRIYSNNGNGDIDKVHPFDEISGTSIAYTANLEDAVDWKFLVQAVVNNIESEGVVIPPAVESPNPIQANKSVTDDSIGIAGISAKNASVGKIALSFVWRYGNVAEKFRIYHDSGTGVINYANPIEFNRIPGFVQNFTTPKIYHNKESKVHKFVIRYVTPYGNENNNTIVNEVILDGVAPDAPTNLSIGTAL